MEKVEAIVRPDGTTGWVRMDEGIVQCRDHTHPTERSAEGCPARLTTLRGRIPFLKKRLREGHALAWEDSKFLMEVLGDSSGLVAHSKSRYEELHARSLKALQPRDDKIVDLEKNSDAHDATRNTGYNAARDTACDAARNTACDTACDDA